LLVTAALLFTVGANVVMFVAAGGDPNGTVVEPDYYRKAVDWDRTMAQRAASDRLGWSAQAALAALAAPDTAGRRVAVTVRDSAGTLVRDAAVQVVLIHNLDAARPVRADLAAQPDGSYGATVAASRAGRWEVRVIAERDAQRFAAVLHAEAP
jgi:nitrogen fixation protein FixH